MKYAIALMSELFTEQEMGRSCYVGTKTKKPCLPLKKRELLEGSLSLSFCSLNSKQDIIILKFLYLFPECIDRRFGVGTVDACWDVLKQKCNQRCCNIANKLKRREKLRVYDFHDFNN